MNLDLLPMGCTPPRYIVGNDDEWTSGIDSVRATLPDAMLEAKRWLLWKSVSNGKGKPRKVPFYVDGGTRSATDTPDDLARLGTYEDARAALERGGFTGLGFALGPDGTGNHWQGVDLDHLSEHPELAALKDRLPGYVERSPSGDGVHALGYGRPFDNLGSISSGAGSGTEAYCSGRYFTMTGDRGRGDLEDLAGFVETELAPLRGKVPKSVSDANLPVIDEWAARGPVAKELSPDQVRDLRSALAAIPSDGRDDWAGRVGHALAMHGDQGRELWLEWSRKSDKFDQGDADRVWASFSPDNIDYRAVLNLAAKEYGWVNPASTGGKSAGDEGRGGLVFTSIGELLKPPKPLEWLVKGYIQPGTHALVFGDPSAGKSLVALDMAASVALGREYRGHRVKQGGVVIIAGEGHFGLRRRALAWGLHHGCLDDLERAPLAISQTGTAMVDKYSVDKVLLGIDAFAEAHGEPVLIVIDTLHRNLGGDENSPTDIASYFRTTDLLRERYSATILVVHHSGHGDKDRGRGHSGIRAGVDTEFSVKVQNDIRTLSATKWKDQREPVPLHFRLKEVALPWQDISGEHETSVVLESAGAPSPVGELNGQKRVALGVLESGPLTEKEWRGRFYQHSEVAGKGADAKRHAFNRARDFLTTSGAVESRDGVYSLPARGVNG